jgi:hypothetical protein
MNGRALSLKSASASSNRGASVAHRGVEGFRISVLRKLVCTATCSKVAVATPDPSSHVGCSEEGLRLTFENSTGRMVTAFRRDRQNLLH